METDLNKVIGALDWEITETATRHTIHEGLTIVRVGDVVSSEVQDWKTHKSLKDHPWMARALEWLVKPTKGNPRRQVKKSVHLVDGFDLTLSSVLVKDISDMTGFAFTTNSPERRLFTWEWFELDGYERATKLQESGRLGVKIGQRGSEWELIHTVFETDVSLRLIPFVNPPLLRPKFRIKIRKGSFVNWPPYKG